MSYYRLTFLAAPSVPGLYYPDLVSCSLGRFQLRIPVRSFIDPRPAFTHPVQGPKAPGPFLDHQHMGLHQRFQSEKLGTVDSSESRCGWSGNIALYTLYRYAPILAFLRFACAQLCDSVECSASPSIELHLIGRIDYRFGWHY